VRHGGPIGGDEFVLVLAGLSAEAGALPPLERLAATLASPVEVTGQSLRLTASVGVSFFPRDGMGREELLRCADLALYRAKQTGRGSITFYAEDMNSQARDRLWLERELRAALERDVFSLHYQPRFALDRLRLAGFECLARWGHPERGAIPPSLFIPLAEETGLICPLGRRIVSQAAAALDG
jgi:predicted signal transduction protein with EAL and GGDEF domain